MSKRDWFLFISTFVVAVLCGMYLYFTTFVPKYIANPVAQSLAEQAAPTWTVAVRLYGGCELTGSCPAFELTSRGAYRYQPTTQAAVETGSVPADLLTQYERALAAERLATLVEPIAPTSNPACRSFADGLDYTIDVRADGQNYALDTCRTALTYTDPLVALSGETLRYLDNPTQYEPTTAAPTGRSGLSGYIERTLDETFDYDEQ